MGRSRHLTRVIPVRGKRPGFQPLSFLFRKNRKFFRRLQRQTAWNFRSGGRLLSQFRRATAALHMEIGIMLSWVVTFLVIALIAGLLGFGGIAGASIEIAKVIFFIALILFVVSAVVGLARGRRI